MKASSTSVIQTGSSPMKETAMKRMQLRPLSAACSTSSAKPQLVRWKRKRRSRPDRRRFAGSMSYGGLKQADSPSCGRVSSRQPITARGKAMKKMPITPK